MNSAIKLSALVLSAAILAGCEASGQIGSNDQPGKDEKTKEVVSPSGQVIEKQTTVTDHPDQ